MRLWHALEAVLGPAAVLAQWQKLLGDELHLLQPYFKPWPQLAGSYPRLDGKREWLSYEVVEFGPDDYVGVCHEMEDRIVLSRDDLIIYEVDVPRLLDDVAQAFGWERVRGEANAGRSEVYLVGNFRPCAGYAFPAFFTIPLDGRSLTNAICALASTKEQPFLLLAPTTRRLHAEGQRVLAWNESAFLTLDETLDATAPGQWQTNEVAERLLHGFTEKHVPKTVAADGTAFFATPAGARWEDLRVRFVDGHTISVTAIGVSRLFQYGDLGMADRRSKRPTKQWDLLRAFAKGYGTLTWGSRDADPRNQKRRELLAKDLKAFFRIDGEPIVMTDDGKGWRTIFTVEPDA